MFVRGAAKGRTARLRAPPWRDGCGDSPGRPGGLNQAAFPQSRRGRQPHPLPVLQRVNFLQQRYALSYPMAEESLYESESMRRFVGVELGVETIPDESTILRFRHLLERHHLTERLFSEVRALLEERRLLLHSGRIVDATIINASSSTRNSTGKVHGVSIRPLPL